MNKKSIEDRFWSKVDIKGSDDCWEWTAYKQKNGYGDFKYNNKTVKAHRFAYAFYFNKILDNLDGFVLHSCDNPSCVNPKHLSLGTHEENMRQMVERGRSFSGNHIGRHEGEKHGGAKLTEKKVIEIKKLLKNGMKQVDIAEIYEVNRRTVSSIKNKKLWRHLK